MCRIYKFDSCLVSKRRGSHFVRLFATIYKDCATVRAAADRFGVSKSTVHKDLSERLPAFNRALYLQAKAVLEENKAQRHIRGGIATRKKYKGA